MESQVRHRQAHSDANKLHTIELTTQHPGGEIKHGGIAQILRLLLSIGYFCSSCAVIVLTQFIGSPIYLINQRLYYAYMALTKQFFGIFCTTLSQWLAPTTIRISGDDSVSDQLLTRADGTVECRFPERIVLIANHQLYSDWLYLWWAAYTNRPKMHGHIYIILKESLKHVPIIGWGMQFYGFIFMSRKFSTDAPRISHRLRKLKEARARLLSGTRTLDPMWLILFPEGTNASIETRARSSAWAKELGIKDMEHVLLPRSAGLFFCMNELRGTVEYLYDCTMAYEGVKRGEYGQDFYTLRTMFLQGQPPPSVNMYWRRFPVDQIPLDDIEKFNLWLRERWLEKDALLEHFLIQGRFPARATNTTSPSAKASSDSNFIETEVKTNHWWEVCYIYVILISFLLVANLSVRHWDTTTLYIYGKITGTFVI
ncbi:hypothetical protein K3495_g4959 [Podosphaera aphanis]|nr:hypothetical protein K3495_g4959 [Podosphaera aphanis]